MVTMDLGMKNIKKKFFLEGGKNGFDYGYCYEDFSVSHLIELIGKGNYKIFLNVM